MKTGISIFLALLLVALATSLFLARAHAGKSADAEQPAPAMGQDAASVGFYESVAGKKFARVQLLTVDGLLNRTQRAEHPDYEPDLNFKKARVETDAEQQSLI
jgi:hypothetical protein